jgi:hypothetical protein
VALRACVHRSRRLVCGLPACSRVGLVPCHFNALTSLSLQNTTQGMDMNHLVPPELPPPEVCLDVMAALRQGADGANFGIADRLELHMPRDSPFVRGAWKVGMPSQSNRPAWVLQISSIPHTTPHDQQRPLARLPPRRPQPRSPAWWRAGRVFGTGAGRASAPWR